MTIFKAMMTVLVVLGMTQGASARDLSKYSYKESGSFSAQGAGNRFGGYDAYSYTNKSFQKNAFGMRGSFETGSGFSAGLNTGYGGMGYGLGSGARGYGGYGGSYGGGYGGYGYSATVTDGIVPWTVPYQNRIRAVDVPAGTVGTNPAYGCRRETPTLVLCVAPNDGTYVVFNAATGSETDELCWLGSRPRPGQYLRRLGDADYICQRHATGTLQTALANDGRTLVISYP